jgi:hypothetical protein
MQIFLAAMNNNKKELTRKERNGHPKWAHLEMSSSLSVASMNKRKRVQSKVTSRTLLALQNGGRKAWDE